MTLTRRETAAILALCVVLFLVGRGPIWDHRWDPDASILWSYAPIPLLVLLCLLRGRRLTARAFFADTFLTALLKFGITALILVTIWSLNAPPLPERPAAMAPPAVVPGAEAPDARPTSRIPPGSTGTLRGVVLDGNGSPGGGALVTVRSGLEALVFAPPEAPFRLEVGGGRFQPALVAASVGQRLLVRATDGSLHTLHAVGDQGETLLNAPILGAGAERVLRIATGVEHGSIRCEVHPDERADLLILTHPFVTRAGDGGEFALRDVPQGTVELAARLGDGSTSSARVTVVAGGTTDVRIGGRP